MVLRKTQKFNHICHLIKLGIFIKFFEYLVNKPMHITTPQKNRKIYIGVQILNQGSSGNIIDSVQ